jgi:formylglycine-generating enzyme required for sulfatase activity
MVLIPAGEFEMGDHHDDGDSGENPVHTVYVDSFFMSRFEITNQQYCDYLNSAISEGLIEVRSGTVYAAPGGTNPYCDMHSIDADSQIDYSGGVFSVWLKDGTTDMSNHPMVEVSWYGAVAYCNYYGYRLPTEAEWEYAGRGGLSTKRFLWGDTISHNRANYYSYWQGGSPYDPYDASPTSGYHPLWYNGIVPYTSPVGFFDGTMKYKADYNWPGSATSYQTTSGANGYGLYDMAGNVWEWCNDWLDEGYYTWCKDTCGEPCPNPTGSASGTYRVLRGGGWAGAASACRVAHRHSGYLPAIRYVDVGFRVARTPEPKVVYVDDDAPNDPSPGDVAISDPLEDGSAEHPFDAIQEAIDVSVNGDTVIVLAGIYYGYGNRDLDFAGRAITVKSTEPNDPCTVAATVIDCQGTAAEPHRAFYFDDNESADSALSGLTITNGHTVDGGAIYCSVSSPTINNCVFTGNVSQYWGGAMSNNWGSNPAVTNCTFSGNSAGNDGGGVYNERSSPTFLNCTFIGNSAGIDGGGMLNDRSSPTLTNCTFSGNSAYTGGGMLNKYSSSPVLINCSFRENSARAGGAMYNCFYTNAKFSNCLFTHNRADEAAGGMTNYKSNLSLTNCIFVGNSGTYGGAMAHHDSAKATMTNCLFYANSADLGGVMYNMDYPSLLLVNCTLAGNSATNGRAFACHSPWPSPGNVQAVNCILWNGGNEIWNNDGSTITITYSDVQSGWPGTGNIDADPCFVDPDSNDLHLLPDSPCIDAGDDSAVPADVNEDLDGNPRIMGLAVDMGAYELQPCWQEQQKLLASDGTAGDMFGIRVSIDGDYAIVGADGDDDKASWAGAAYIFKREGDNWVEKTKLTASDGAAHDRFGLRVSLNGDYAIGGAANASPSGAWSGAAYIFKRSAVPNDPNWYQQAKLTASDGAAYDDFGISVSITGRYAIVGAQRDDIDGFADVGSAYIFEMPPGGWVDTNETAKLTASDGGPGDIFGCSVSIGSDYAIVGACRHDTNGLADSGSAYIFEKPPGGWVDMTETAKLTAPNPAAHDSFGSGVSISEDYVIAGAPGDDSLTVPGSVYVFKHDGESWVEQAILTASDSVVGDFFGAMNHISGDYAVLSAHGDDGFTGSAYVFKRDGETWTQQAKLTASDRATDDNFGPCAISGSYVIVGAGGNDDNGSLSGSAYIFENICNEAPDANAGEDQTCDTGPDGTAQIPLNGSDSNDPDGDALTYRWIIDGNQVATGVNPTIGLPCGTYTIELIVNDGTYDSEPDYIQVTVLDGTPPTIVCPNDVILECPADTSVAANGSATATDNCDDSPAITYSDVISGTCPKIIERTWTATDAADNSSSCVQVITVVDTTPPVITGVPADETVECDSVPPPVEPTATDNCDSNVPVIFNETRTDGDCPSRYTLTRTWTATDDCGNSTTETQVITVQDTTAAVFTIVPVDANVMRDGNGNIAELNAWLTSTVEAVDNCGSVSIVNDFTSFPYECGNTGSLTVTWTATDDCGNPNSVPATFTIEDPTAGVTYDGDLLLSTAGNPTVNANLLATLRDNAGNVPNVDSEQVTFTLTAEGVQTIVVTADSNDGVANAVMSLEPAIYMIQVTLGCSEYTASAILVVYNPEGGFATGGGWLVPEDDGINTHPNLKAHFGFSVEYKDSLEDPNGSLEFRYQDDYVNLESTLIERLVVTGGKIAQFKGWAVVNGVPGNWFFVKAIDNGSPGKNNDIFEIKIWFPGVDPEGDPSERAGGVIRAGNIVVHTK